MDWWTWSTSQCQKVQITAAISRRQEPLSTYTIRVNDHPIEKVQSYKYLGVIISSDLSWGNHVSSVSSKAMKHMGMLYRCFYRDCTPDTLRTLYISCVRPLLEYAVPVWDPHLVKDIHALESVQRFATKVCTKTWRDVSYSERLCILNLPTLQVRRMLLKLCLLYKIVHGNTFMPNCPVKFRHNQYSTRSGSNNIKVPFARTAGFYNTFFCYSTRLWNTLPVEVVSCSSLSSFKKACNSLLTLW